MSAQDIAEICRIEDYRAEAILACDREGLARMTSDDYLHIDSSGRIRDKTGFLDGLRASGGGYVRYEIFDNVVRVYGATAVVAGMFKNAHRANDGTFLEKCARHVRVYVCEDGRWQNVFHQAFEVAVGAV